MNLKLAKQIRKHVREKYPFMSATPVYEYDAFGARHLAAVCQRGLYQNIKRNIKRKVL